MRDTSLHGWQSWRVKPVEPAAAAPRFARPRLAAAEAGRGEAPGPDGIRRDLVARVRAEIAAGTYDTEEKWRLAEERLLAGRRGDARPAPL